uniref:WD_REPEATS_REGION domain-containing protein n=1 Tax=Panagrellus redivivus TaxID=6233 RepID=A0A7E4VV83_PANRE
MTGIIAGQLNARNKDAIDWHPKGLVGYGCHAVLAIVDVSTARTIQTLCSHEKAISLIRFGLQESFDDNTVKCASSDISGKVIVWDVLQGKKETSFQRLNDEVIQMHWFTQYGIYSDCLATLYSSNTLVLNNARNGEKFWVLPFSTRIFDFTIDLKDFSNMAFAGTNGSILLLRNVEAHETPVLSDSTLTTFKATDDDNDQLIQLTYHKAYEDLLFAVFSTKVVLVHTDSKQIIATVSTENMFPICRLLPCGERDAFYLVHANGVLSFWRARLHEHRDRYNAELTYEQTCYNDAQRFFSKNRVFGAQICPVTESNAVLLFHSGKLVFYQLNHNDQISLTPYRAQNLTDITSFDYSGDDQLCFTQQSLLPSLGANSTTVRIRPIEGIQSSPNQFAGKQLAAIGCSTGCIQFVDVFTGKLEKELNIHNCAVKCLEWVGPDMIISAAYSSSVSAHGSVRNDIFLTNVLTGARKRFRPEGDESPVQLLRVSYYRRYLAISFRNDPLEIWDMKAHRLLRRMSRKCPIIVDMAWSTKHVTKKTAEGETPQLVRENLVVLDNDNHLYHVIVKGLHVKDGKEVNTQWKSGSAPIRCMTWKDDLLAFGDVNGYLRIWDLSKRTFNQINSPSMTGPVLRCVFSRLSGDSTIAVQYAKGVVLFDAVCLQPTPHMLATSSSLLDIDMFGVIPVCISSEGICRFAATTDRNNGIAEKSVPKVLSNDFIKKAYALATSPESTTIEDEDDTEGLAYFKQRFANEPDLTKREASIAKLIGNLPTLSFLHAANSSISGEKCLPLTMVRFWHRDAYRKYAENLTKILLGTCKTTEQLDYAVERAVVLGKLGWAKYGLLNTDVVMPPESYRIHAFKSCLFNAEVEAEEPRCFIKMVATNLIAQNQLNDGIVLLFLIDQGMDACRFLASNGRWAQALQYAKMAPSTEKFTAEAEQLLSRWADHLHTNGRVLKTHAAMIYASLGQTDKAFDLVSAPAHEHSCFKAIPSTA